ncbi:FAD-dependent oxidoreductase [Archangium violaceum]
MSGDANGKLGKHVVVLGSSMAGLLATRVLSERFEKVTLVERDALQDNPEPRKGSPQAQHLHVLLARGAQVIEELFPGFFKELVEAGSCPGEMSDAAWYHFGQWKARAQTGVIAYSQTRGLLDWKVRQRVLALPNVTVLDRCEAHGYLTTPDKSRVTGLKLQRQGEPEMALDGVDLVVDASGRGSQTPRWLEELGYPRVEQTIIKTDVAYNSRMYHRPKNHKASWSMLAVYADPPNGRRMGVLMPIEKDRWILSLCGILKDHAPTDEAGFLQFARELPKPDIYDAVKDAEPAGPIVVHKFPGSQRRHYDQMARFPESLVVLGDALCSLNPIYGQGMTASALEVMLLRECLLKQGPGELSGLAQRFRKQVPSVLLVPWMLALTEDLSYPEVEGQRPPGFGLMRWYATRLHNLAAHDPEVVRGFANVQHMLKSPAALASPGILWRVLTSRWSSPTT